MKRFYREVAIAAEDGGWRLTLDGRAVKTAQGRPQIVPSAPLAEALAAEWAGQGEEIAPARFVLRDLVDYALDVVAVRREEIERAVTAFAETDTLCYRAEPDEALWAHQQAQWEPYLAAVVRRWDIHFERVSGIIHRPQPAATLARLALVIATLDDFQLAALQTLTSLAGSLVLGLAALEEYADIPALWDAACLEEDWQAELWGHDAEAVAHRAQRGALFAAAAGMVRLVL